MLLPGRVPGYKDSDVKLLPSSTTKHAIWEFYLQAAATSSMRSVAYSTFTQLWRQLLPNIIVMKPMSDLCWVCQQNSAAITRSANRPEEEKSTVSTHQLHLHAHPITLNCLTHSLHYFALVCMHVLLLNSGITCTCYMHVSRLIY